jgi:Zn-dependent protease with chaperone function
MFWAYLLVPWAASLFAGACAMPVAKRARPHVAAPVLLACGVVLAASTTASLALLGFVGVARMNPIARDEHWTGPTPRGDAIPAWCGIIAAIALLVIIVRGLLRAIAVERNARATSQEFSARRRRVVEVDDDGAYAYACRPVPWRPGVVLMSRGLRDALSSDELAVVLAHEAAHLDGQHALYMQLATIIAAIDPLLAPLADAVEFSLERIADEQAARSVSRPVAATALAHAALHVVHLPLDALGHATGHVPLRIEALLRAPEQRCRSTLPVIAASIAAAWAIVLVAHHTEILFEVIRRR